MRFLVVLQRGSLLCALAGAAVLAQAGTWSSDLYLGINANPQKVYNKTWIYRNLALQGEAWCNVGTVGCEHDEVELKGPGDPNEGYPKYGGTLVVASRLTLDNVGDYELNFQGSALVTNLSDGRMMTGPVYYPDINRSIGTIHIPDTITGDAKIVVQFESVSADFGDLKVMQPNMSANSTAKFTPAAVAHYARAKVIRGMDRMLTNGSLDVAWKGSAAAGKSTLLGYQHSLKGVLDLATKVNANPWVNIPASANDAYITSFVAELNTYLPADKVAVVEFSNEPWNSDFLQYMQIANKTWQTGKIAVGAITTDGNRILSVARDRDGIVTITLSQPHNKAVNDKVYAAADSQRVIAAELVTLTTGTGGNILKYDSHVRNAEWTGTVDGTSFNSYVLLVPSNELVKPLANFGKPGLYATPYEAKIRYEFKRLRTIYDTVSAAGLAGRVRIVKGIRLSGYEQEIYGLAWAKEKYGSLAWLDTMGGGLAPAFYMQPADPDHMDTWQLVIQQLDQAREGINTNLIKLRNITLAMGQSTINGYEGGPHNDLKPTQPVADAVQIAHRDRPEMTALIATSWADWVNRGGGPLMYFHAGATDTYNGLSDNAGHNANNTWSLIEGTLTSTGNRVKDVFFTAQQNVSTSPVGVDTVTKGDIVLANVHAMLEDRGARSFMNEVYVDPQTKQTSYTYLVTADTARSYTITFDGCSAAGDNAEPISLYVDGVLQLSRNMVGCANIYGELATQPTLGTVRNLQAGTHVVEARLGNSTRTWPLVLYRLHFN